MTGETLKGKIRKCTERKECEVGTNTPFARDVLAAMLVDVNKEMAAILVKGNIPSRFDSKLHACFLFI